MGQGSTLTAAYGPHFANQVVVVVVVVEYIDL